MIEIRIHKFYPLGGRVRFIKQIPLPFRSVSNEVPHKLWTILDISSYHDRNYGSGYNTPDAVFRFFDGNARSSIFCTTQSFWYETFPAMHLSFVKLWSSSFDIFKYTFLFSISTYTFSCCLSCTRQFIIVLCTFRLFFTCVPFKDWVSAYDPYCLLNLIERKREVPRGVRNSKVRRQDKVRRDWSRH